MKQLKIADTKGHVLVEEPPIAQALFSSTKFAWAWLIVRVWLGYQWIDASSHKIFDPAWVGSGTAIRGFWERAVTPNPATGKAVVVYDWYASFLNMLLAGHHEVWFGKVIAYGELLVGLGLIFGALTGIAAFSGSLMNWSFMMAGTTSTNPLLFGVTILIILAWRVAGFYGLDRFLLPMLGTPWKQHEAVEAVRTPKISTPKTPAPIGAR
jgi:thiosulfate dehydrogenase [quinone] large subunit